MSFELRGVSVRYSPVLPQLALSDVTLSIAQGEQVALIGPSGAGKTTLLHTFAFARQLDGGSLRALDAEPWGLSSSGRHALRSRIFLAPQTPPLPPRQRVVTAVLAGRLPQWSLYKALTSLFKPSDPQAAYDALAKFDLQDKLYARVDRLSGGERQRCSLARLLVSNAQALLVDEPLSALDPALARQTLDVLQQEASARRATLVCSLHQVELALAHFPRIVGLRAGRVVFDAPRDAVSEQMIAALYQQAGRDREPPASAGAEPGIVAGRGLASGCY
ncbi:ATP-binding cassette domain-containing protein [Noviherbaspirillum sp. CPCC 100848]|uniref:ATP-binding cassette domain-containing protein n=1 Tax=Noviherbaspirillum album TaxID=3080276 RepID=A0ABU6J682_9BURK|nr:ATP-binding cassette domain-containing protein [Noviherbaspirillum sp. CPCC 100848]MEC4718911.1 ATP-binding cassette domain-containing protein [Noviherbaspirillum sp. CPCC 100848]